ncbi:MAG: flagellar basal body rod protein FlgC [Bdellovibrionales bacterium]
MELDLNSLISISSYGMRAQAGRMRTLAENIANSSTTGTSPGADPYRRKIPVFQQMVNKELGVKVVESGRPIDDMKDFPVKYDPSHPAADAKGYVKMPNVVPLMETIDMREAQRSYEANLTVIEATRAMIGRTIDLLRA